MTIEIKNDLSGECGVRYFCESGYGRSETMIENNLRAYFLFDGDCGICTWSADFIRKIDRKQIFQIVPYQNFSESELMKFGITVEHCNRKIQIISKVGKVYQGALGLNYFLWKFFPWKLLILIIYLVPLFLLLEIIAYRLIAKNRHYLSRWFGLTACRLPQRDANFPTDFDVK